MKTLILAHYYTEPDVQEMADYVGDSLELAKIAQREQPDRIIFAGVRFMAETAKLLVPNAEVILPDGDSTCSLVEQTDVKKLAEWVEYEREMAQVLDNKEVSHIMYINSSVEMKTLADIIVTSRNVDDIILSEQAKGKVVIFSPDRNMANYINYIYDTKINSWNAVCEVHDKFKAEEIEKVMRGWTDGPKFLLAHPESPLPVLRNADVVGSTNKMLQWVKDYPHKYATIFVATEEGLLYNMRQARPKLDIRQAPMYSGCQCNSCPYMKMNTLISVREALHYGGGIKIDYLTDDIIEKATIPINRMMDF